MYQYSVPIFYFLCFWHFHVTPKRKSVSSPKHLSSAVEKYSQVILKTVKVHHSVKVQSETLLNTSLVNLFCHLCFTLPYLEKEQIEDTQLQSPEPLQGRYILIGSINVTTKLRFCQQFTELAFFTHLANCFIGMVNRFFYFWYFCQSIKISL